MSQKNQVKNSLSPKKKPPKSKTKPQKAHKATIKNTSKSAVKSKTLLQNKTKIPQNSLSNPHNQCTRNTSNDSDSLDSSDEEVLIRTGDVPENWYDGFEHFGYDINSKKVIKQEKEDEIEKFIKKANDKNWWRNIYDAKNNSSVYLSDKDLEMINRIRAHKFADKKVTEDDYFEDDIPYQVHPLSNHKRSKSSFGFSKSERKTINRLIYLYKNGLMPLDSDEEKKKKKLLEEPYDIWAFENEDENDLLKYRPGYGFEAPKRELPTTEESYNVGEKDGVLRRIPRYEKLIDEELERCCDLFLAARSVKKKLDIKEEDLMPKLPKPEELRPFPTKETIIYKGHQSAVRQLCCDYDNDILISSDDGNFVFFWDIQSTKIVAKVDLNEKVKCIRISEYLHLVVICTVSNIYFILPKYIPENERQITLELSREKIIPKIKEKYGENDVKNEEKDEKNETKNDAFVWKVPEKGTKEWKNNVLFYMHFTQGVVKDVVWHSKGDYFSTITKNNQGKVLLYVHSLTKMSYQVPFNKIKGNITCCSFHPTKPHFIVSTSSNIFIYNLQKQELIRKFVSNLSSINKIAVHQEGEDLVAGDKSGKVAWFQLELSSKPYKQMDYHQDKIKSVDFCKDYPLFLSASKNGKLVVYYSKVYNEELKDPLIVPLKVLKADSNKTQFTSAVFHPEQPWIFCGQSNGIIKMWA